MKFVEISCARCGKQALKPIHEINRCKRKGQVNFFCSGSCGSMGVKKPPRKCEYCALNFASCRSTARFCSRGCVEKARDKKRNSCLRCSKKLYPSGSTYCRDCGQAVRRTEYLERWLQGEESGNSGEQVHPYIKDSYC